MSIVLVYIPALALVAVTLVATALRRHSGHGVGHHHGGRLISIDLYAHESRLAGVSAGFKMAVCLGFLLMCVFLNSPKVALIVMALCLFAAVALGGLPLGTYIRLLLIPIFFILAGSIVILLEFSLSKPVGALCSLRAFGLYVFITEKSLGTTILVWSKSFGALSSLYLLILTTPIGEVFTVLDHIHTPAILVELMNMMYRFIFVMLETQAEMADAAASRLGYRDFRTSVRSFGLIAGNLLIVSLRKANAYYDALESRLYNGRLSFLTEEKRATKGQIVAALLIFAYLFLVYFLVG